MTAPAIQAIRVSKFYGDGGTSQQVVREASFAIEPGQCCCLIGPSGSGKTTLLSILGCLLTPDAGDLRISGRRVGFEDDAELAAIRRTEIGFVFQHAQLLPFLTVGQNLAVVGHNSGLDQASIASRASALLERLGMNSFAQRKPQQLSGGQRQRAAIARALIHRPAIILADEPTAALDWATAENVVRLLTEQTEMEGTALLMVTHDTRLLPFFHRTLRIEDGVLKE